MKGVLDQKKFDELGNRIIDIVGLHKPVIGRMSLVSYFEPKCDYDGIRVKSKAEADNVLEKSCLKDGLDLYGINLEVVIKWDNFAVEIASDKGIPSYVIIALEDDIPLHD